MLTKKEEMGFFRFVYLSIRGKSNGRQVEFCDNKLPLFEGSSLSLPRFYLKKI